MNKQEIILALQGLKNNGIEIAEIKVNISKGGAVLRSDESILVRLVDEPKNEGNINNGKHWDLFDNIDEFKDNTYFRLGADESYPLEYISDFISVDEFTTDYNDIKEAV